MMAVVRSSASGIVVFCLWSALVAGQQRNPLAGLTGDLTPTEVQQLFDAFELVRAQEMLGLSDEQYPEFVAKLKTLQQTRRQGQQERLRHLRGLQRLSARPGTSDSDLTERLDALTVHDREMVESERAAIAGIDAVLSGRQRVRFRLFEQAMERRRVELLMRAQRQRQAPRRNGR